MSTTPTLTDAAIRALPAGRELNALIALHVIGWEEADAWPWSTEMADAWRVVEKMQSLGYSYALWDVCDVSSSQQNPAAAFRRGCIPPAIHGERPHPANDEQWIAHADTMPLAVCRAALLAVRMVPGGG